MQNILKIGHRGAKGYQPENTLVSFQKALDLNVDGVEFDVHVCKSGELIVIHDFTVDRTTNGTGAVAELTLSELKALRINDNSQIPTLEEVTPLFNKNHLINIELKGLDTAKKVCDFIEKLIQQGAFCYSNFIVSSFDKAELKTVADYQPQIPIGILKHENLAEALEWAEQFSAVAIIPHFSLLTKENVALMRQKGYSIYTWTVNEPADIVRVKALSVDAIITDFPDRI